MAVRLFYEQISFFNFQKKPTGFTALLIGLPHTHRSIHTVTYNQLIIEFGPQNYSTPNKSGPFAAAMSPDQKVNLFDLAGACSLRAETAANCGICLAHANRNHPRTRLVSYHHRHHPSHKYRKA